MPVFVDTGGWFAYFVRRDPNHEAGVNWMRQNRQPLVTTDYVLDELFTLLKLRESHSVAAAAGVALLEPVGDSSGKDRRARLSRRMGSVSTIQRQRMELYRLYQ
jgi:predicted nucleic acid-binding protein